MTISPTIPGEICPYCKAPFERVSTDQVCPSCGRTVHTSNASETTSPGSVHATVELPNGTSAAISDSLTPVVEVFESAGGTPLATIAQEWKDAVEQSETPKMTIRQSESGRNVTDQTIAAPTKGEKTVHTRATLVIQPRKFRHHSEGASLPADYDLLELLGEGGMGVVYLARQASIDRSVAVKMLKSAATRDESQRDKFLSEAVITGELDHPNIVPIYDLGTNPEGAYFYAMKRVQGTPWERVFNNKSTHENVEILMKVTDAVAFAHSRGVIHRDLKPENVMLGGFGEVLVMDWGLALPFGNFAKFENVSVAHSMGGTPAYMAPEMTTSSVELLTPAVDVYLLGAILFEIVTGSPPHYGQDVMKCLLAAARNAIVPTEKSGELLDIARRAMATRPSDRYASVPEFQSAIRAYQSHSESFAMTSRAADQLQLAKSNSDYSLFSRALFAFEEAATLWPGNVKAIDGANDATLAYAECASRKGDFDLGVSLLDDAQPTHTPLLRQLRASITDRESRKHRLKLARQVVVGLVAAILVVVTSAFFLVNSQRNEAIRQRGIATSQREIALQQSEEAKKQRDLAVIAESEANKQRDVANSQREIAEQQRELAIAAKSEATTERDRAEYEAYVSSIGLAAAKIDENAFGTARDLLNGCKRDLRHWEWGRLMHLCHQSVRDVTTEAPIEAIDVSPDGQYYATAGWNGVAQVWRTQSGELVQTFQHDGQYVYAVAFSPDGRSLATGSNGKSSYVKLWNIASGELIRSFQGHRDAVLSVQFSRDGGRLLTSSFDHSIRLWNVHSGETLRTLLGHTWWVWSARFSRDEKRIVSASQDGTVIVWDAENGERHPGFTGHKGPVYSADFSPDGKQVASAGYDKLALLWTVGAEKEFDFEKLLAGEQPAQSDFQAFVGHTAAVRSVRFSRDGDLLVTSGHDNTVRVWRRDNGRALRTLRGHDGWVRACQFTNDGNSVVSAGYDHKAKWWSIDGYQESRVFQGHIFQGHVDAILSADFSPDGRHVVTASRDRRAMTWNSATGKAEKVFEEGHAFLTSQAIFFPNGRRLVTSAVDNTVRIWDLASGIEKTRIAGTGRSAAMALSADGRHILTGSDRHSARLWDADTGERVHEFEGHKIEVTAVAISPSGALYATGDANGRIMLWQADNGALLHRLSFHTGRIAGLVFSADGSVLYSASDDKTVCPWRVAKVMTDRDPEVPRDEAMKHPDSVVDMAHDRLVERLLTVTADGTATIWNATKRELIHTIKLPDCHIDAAAFSEDGQRCLLVDTNRRRVHLWDVVGNREILMPSPSGTVTSMLDLGSSGGGLWDAQFCPEANRILTVGGNEARIWEVDLQTGVRRNVMSFSPHGAVAAAAYSPDGKKIVTGSRDNSARIWSVGDGRGEIKLAGHTAYVNGVCFSPDGKMVATASDDKSVALWDAESGDLVRRFVGHEDRVLSARFSADGTKLISASADKSARIWNVADRSAVQQFRGHDWGLTEAAFSSDGKFVITASNDNTAKIWNASNGQLLQTLAGHSAGVASIAFSPDARRAMTGSEDFSAKLWDVQTGTEILSLKGHTQEVTTVRFSPDGRNVLTGSRDGTAILWMTVEWHD